MVRFSQENLMEVQLHYNLQAYHILYKPKIE